MARSKLVQKNEKIAEAVVDGFSRISDHFADQYLTKEGESVEEAKARLNRENEERRKAAGAKHPHHGHE